jgi:hypothetical protein
MAGVFAVVTAALSLTALPPLPKQGLALDTKAGVQLQTLAGRAVAMLPGLDLAVDQLTAHTLVLRNGRGRLFALDPAQRRLRERKLRRGCRVTDVALTVCPRTIRLGTRVVAREPPGIGHWVWAERSPSGDAILAQWSAECEAPIAYRIRNGVLTAYGSSESVALGWLPNGAALIHFPNGPCAGDSSALRGIYVVPRTGRRRLLLRTSRFAQYAMWGG